MSLCARGAYLYRLLSAENRPVPATRREGRESPFAAMWIYQNHVAECPQCGARQELAA